MRASRVAALLILCCAIGESSFLILARFHAITVFSDNFFLETNPFTSRPLSSFFRVSRRDFSTDRIRRSPRLR